jgi:hypothetical protein
MPDEPEAHTALPPDPTAGARIHGACAGIPSGNPPTIAEQRPSAGRARPPGRYSPNKTAGAGTEAGEPAAPIDRRAIERRLNEARRLITEERARRLLAELDNRRSA